MARTKTAEPLTQDQINAALKLEGEQAGNFIYVEIGDNNCWGKGFSRDQAHVAARRPKRFIVWAVTDAYAYVDGMGSLYRDAEARSVEVERKGC